MPVVIRKVRDEHGWLGNMSPFPIVFNGKEFRTAEALFQSLRFDDEEIIEAIRAEKSPMTAKFVAKRHQDKMVVEQCGLADLDNMRLCLRLKIEQHPDLLVRLLGTGSELIVEDCSNRRRGSGLFWGAALDNGEWHGQNWLGRLWMEIRESRQQLSHPSGHKAGEAHE